MPLYILKKFTLSWDDELETFSPEFHFILFMVLVLGFCFFSKLTFFFFLIAWIIVSTLSQTVSYLINTLVFGMPIIVKGIRDA